MFANRNHEDSKITVVYEIESLDLCKYYGVVLCVHSIHVYIGGANMLISLDIKKQLII